MPPSPPYLAVLCSPLLRKAPAQERAWRSTYDMTQAPTPPRTPRPPPGKLWLTALWTFAALALAGAVALGIAVAWYYPGLPERCANLCFGGPARNRLFMAASQSVYALYVNAQGAPGG